MKKINGSETYFYKACHMLKNVPEAEDSSDILISGVGAVATTIIADDDVLKNSRHFIGANGNQMMMMNNVDA